MVTYHQQEVSDKRKLDHETDVKLEAERWRLKVKGTLHLCCVYLLSFGFSLYRVDEQGSLFDAVTAYVPAFNRGVSRY